MLKIGVAVLVVVAGALLYVSFKEDQSPRITAEEAVKQAQSYVPEGLCTLALVDAVHKETGARYTFPNGCLAPGWEPAD